MDVSAPITAAIPGVPGLVVAALLPTTAPLTGAEVATRCPNASEMGVRKALRRLVHVGLVLSVPGGFVLNRDHLVSPAIELLDGLYGRLRTRIADEINAWGGQVSFAGLFGSAARRDGDSDSDIDVLVVSEDSGLDDFAVRLSEAVELWTGNTCHVVSLTGRELRRLHRAKEPIIESWRAELDPVIGSIEEELAAAETKR